MQERQIVTEEPSNFKTFKKPPVTAKKSYEECDLVSKESLECVSPEKPVDEVIFIF